MWRICRVKDMRTGGWEFLQFWFRSSKCHLKCLKFCCSQVCSCCAMRSLYFTWHNVCSVCRRSDHSFLWFCAWWNCFVTFMLCVRRVVCPGCCLEVGWSLLYWIFRCHYCRLAVNLHLFPLSDASALQALREPSSELLQANRDERWAKPEKLLERALVLEFSLVSRLYQLNQLPKILHLKTLQKNRRINRSSKCTKALKYLRKRKPLTFL